MRRRGSWATGWLGLSVLLTAAGCSDSNGQSDGAGPNAEKLRGDVAAGLLRADSCEDLLTKVQNDAIAKLDLAVVRYKLNARLGGVDVNGDGIPDGTNSSGGNFADGGVVSVDEGSASPGSAMGGNSGGIGGGTVGGSAGGGGVAPPSGDSANGSGGPTSVPRDPSGPTGASETNTQVEGVDEADFVKVVKMGQRMFLLHGSSLFALNSWPANATALTGTPLKIEGNPIDMFVTDDASQAVIFSSVYGYPSSTPGYYGGAEYGGGSGAYCGPDYCGGGYAARIKITVADLTSSKPETKRELYFEGNYLSSRRYGDVVRGVIQGYPRYSNIYAPDFDVRDPWGRQYAPEVIDDQLDAWRERTASAIRSTVLEDWVPVAKEQRNGKLVAVEPDCGSYYVPVAGLADYGMTHVLSLDISGKDNKLGGVTIMGATSTVYSNLETLVLAQPDYRWNNNFDVGFSEEQQTALHLFSIAGKATEYKASGWVPGHLPQNNAQFGLDEKDGTLRVVTSGSVRDNPKARAEDPAFWQSHTENRVFTTQVNDGALKVVGSTENYGKPNETTQSARFVGDRAYVVTFRNTDPLVVVDVADAKNPKVLGAIEIPGFSQYMHPLDDNHLITVGQSGNGWGIQLQLFDVSNAMSPKRTDVLDFGQGSSSEASYSHKAFTFFAEEGLIALPVYGDYWSSDNNRTPYRGYTSTLQVVHVDAKGFDALGYVDHGPLFAAQNCGRCDQYGCYDYGCYYQPEVRRGHFVKDNSATFVYSFSYGGVLVNDLKDLKTPVATVKLPQPVSDSSGWYSEEARPGGGGGGESNSSTSGGWSGGGSANGGGIAMPPPSPEPAPADAGVAIND